jgi:hypothetical protein
VKKPAKGMEILEAYDLAGSLRGAAQLSGCDHKTVAHWVAERDLGLVPAQLRQPAGAWRRARRAPLHRRSLAAVRKPGGAAARRAAPPLAANSPDELRLSGPWVGLKRLMAGPNVWREVLADPFRAWRCTTRRSVSGSRRYAG